MNKRLKKDLIILRRRNYFDNNFHGWYLLFWLLFTTVSTAGLILAFLLNFSAQNKVSAQAKSLEQEHDSSVPELFIDNSLISEQKSIVSQVQSPNQINLDFQVTKKVEVKTEAQITLKNKQLIPSPSFAPKQKKQEVLIFAPKQSIKIPFASNTSINLPLVKSNNNSDSTQHWNNRFNKPLKIAQNQPEGLPPVSEEKELEGIELSLSDVIILAVQNNREIKNAYLDRIIDRKDLEVAEDTFVPNFTPQLTVSFERDRAGSSSTVNRQIDGGATVSMAIPTGADIELEWTGLGNLQDTDNFGISNNEDILSQDFELSFNQPLLRGFGIDVNTAPIKIARLNEQINIFELKSTLIDTVTQAIQAYRSLLQAQENLKIQQLSLETTRRQLEVIQALIEAGRRARSELVQSETNIANRQVSLLSAQNQLEEARLNLIEILDLDNNFQIIASEIPNIEQDIALDQERLGQVALANNPEYLQSVKRVEIAQLDLLLAEDEKRWDLGVNFTYGLNSSNTDNDDTNNWRAGLTLTREFGDLQREQAVERAEVDLKITNNELIEARESLTIELKNRLRDVEFNFKQVELASRARELSEQQLANEREKLKLGVRGTRIIDIVDFENDLVTAKNQEVNAIINYFNAITLLEQTLGTTLESWNIEIQEDSL